MIVTVTGIRALHRESYAFVESHMRELDKIVKEVRFGGAIGADTVALRSCPPWIRKVVIVPFTLADQPSEARQAILRYADCLTELRCGHTKSEYGYRARNIRMLDGADRVDAFTDLRPSGGTWHTVEAAIERKIEVIFIEVKRKDDARGG